MTPLSSPLDAGPFHEPAHYAAPAWRSATRWSWAGFLALGGLFTLAITAILSSGAILSQRFVGNFFTSNLALFMLIPFTALLWGRGSINLSLGYTAGVGALILGITGNLWVALTIAVLIGAIQGASIGALSAWWRIPGLALSLVMAYSNRSLMLLGLDQGSIIVELPASVLSAAPWAFLVLTAGFLVLAWRLGPKDASQPLLNRLWPWVLSSVAAALAGVYIAMQLRSVSPNLGNSMDFEPLLIILVSGSLFGNRKTNWPAVVAATLGLAVLRTQMSYLGLNLYHQWALLCSGTMCLLGIHWLMNFVVDYVFKRRASTTASSPAGTANI